MVEKLKITFIMYNKHKYLKLNTKANTNNSLIKLILPVYAI